MAFIKLQNVGRTIAKATFQRRWMKQIRREPTAMCYKACIRAEVLTSHQKKAQKAGALSAHAETSAHLLTRTPHAQRRLCVYRDIVWNRIALAKDGGGQDRNFPDSYNSGLCLRSLEWWKRQETCVRLFDSIRAVKSI
jgi:hypothetical protein